MTVGERRDLAATASRHMWGHFTPINNQVDEMPIIERGDGCYVWDDRGNRYLDGLAGLFVSQVGHGRSELALAAHDQSEKLAYFPIWSYTHPGAALLSERLAKLAPGDINRVFFTTGGSEAVESAWKLARQYFKLVGQPERHKVISRHLAYHGTSMGALSITGLHGLKAPFEPLVPGAIKVANTNQYRKPPCGHEADCLCCAEDIEQAILREGPETVAAVFVEPVQNAGGCFVPPDGYFARVREICDTHGVLLVSDEVICAFGRLGHMFGSERYGYQPDIITVAKGLTSGYSPMGAMLVGDHLVEPFAAESQTFLHGYTFAGHPVSAAVAMANLDIFESESLLSHVRDHEGEFRGALDRLDELPIVGQIRGAGYFYGIELVRDRDTKAGFTPEEAESLLRGFLSNRLLELGLICRTDDRGDPVIQLSPPLIAGQEQFNEISEILRKALTEAMSRLGM